MLNFQSFHAWRAGFVLVLAAAGSTVAACGSDESIGGIDTSATGGYFFGTGGFPTTGGFGGVGTGGFPTAGGFPTTGGFPATGGFGPTGGATSTGGASPDGGDGGPNCVQPAAPVVDTSTFPTCSGVPGCTDGRCVPNTLIPAGAAGLLATCDTATTCAPDIFVAYANQYLPPECKSVGGYEGRCLSTCIPQVAAQATFLPQDICKTTERCAPCYDPRTGADTSACRQGTPGCDEPKNPAQTFAKCCGGVGYCVPKSAVPTADQAQLGPETCTGTDVLCAPDKLTDSAYKPPACTSLANLEGRCLPECLPAVAAQKDRLPTTGCATGERCAPCYDPVTGADTGACTRGGDKPVNPPTTFPTCCGPLGHCVPGSILTPAQQALLGKDTCTAAGDLCAPDVFAGSGLKAETCRALGTLNAEGRCIPACLPSIQAQASRLDQATCDAGFLCAPCFDPTTGATTGACDQNGDKPAEPAKTYPTCCGGEGSCVPKNLVPTDQQSQLGSDTCTGADILCAPKKLADPAYKPPTCASIGGLEGRCLASCLPDVAAQAANLPKATCGTGELCAPCYDPFTGAATGACSLNGDKPVNQPTTFPVCCNNLGHCVPTANLSVDQQKQLGPDTCAPNNLCAPDAFAAPGQTAQTCRAVFGSVDAEGRCVPDCVPMIQAHASRLQRGTCPVNTLCAPCFDPITGASTSACSQNGDKPVEPAKTFPTCCGTNPALGVCVPSTLVPPAQVSQLGVDTCTGTGVLCAPKSLTDSTVKPTTCTAPGAMEARCLPACLPQIQAQASNLRQVTCGAGELCAPCYNPIDGVDTQACRINGDLPTQAPKPFTSCGNGRGLCVPTELVPASLASSIPACTGATGYLCAPIEKINNINFKFPSCDPQLQGFPPDPNQDGACLPQYIVTFQAQTQPLAANLTRSNCVKTDDICVPCVIPIVGTVTHACD
jgi:hypothetical protein